MNTILETYPDANPAALMTGSDDKLHFTDAFGETWCHYSTYFLDELGEELELFEKVDDGKLDEFCPGCKEGADEEKEEA